MVYKINFYKRILYPQLMKRGSTVKVNLDSTLDISVKYMTLENRNFNETVFFQDI